MSAPALQRDGAVMRLSGEMSMQTADAVLQPGRAAIAQGVQRVDLAGLTQLDSAAIAVILDWLREARRVGATLAVENAPEALRNLATLYSVATFIPFVSADR